MNILHSFWKRASLVAQLVKNPLAMWETWVRSLGWKDPLEKGTASCSSILTWRIPWTVWSMGLQRVRHSWVTFTFTLLILKDEPHYIFFFLMCSLSKLFAGSLYHFYSFYLRKSWGKKRHAYLLGQKGKPGIVRPVSTFNLTPTKLLRITYSPLICK